MADRAAKRLHPAPEAVAAFLRAEPGWLALHPELYAALEPPRRLHGDRLADHMAAMLARARADLRAGTEDRRAAEGFTHRMQEAALALMRAADPAATLGDLTALLRIDSARLCCEAACPGAAWVPPGTVAALLGRRVSVIQDAHRDPILHGEAAAALARREALVRVDLEQGPALLALACRDGRALAGATAGALGFLGQTIAAVLRSAR